MMIVLFSVAVIFVFLCVAELLWRIKVIRGEAGRKCVHIAVGTFVAFWPFWMSFGAIQLLSGAFLAGVIVSRQWHVFDVIHRTRSKNWGEIWFAVSIGALATFCSSKYIFAAAVMHMSLADGLAGLIGWRYGKPTRYKICGQVKSWAGTLTFAFVSAAIIIWFLIVSPYNFQGSAWPVFVGLPLLAAFVENISIRGTDNIAVPLLVFIILNAV